MKEIILRAEAPLYNYVDIDVIDILDDGIERQRCKVTCDFGKYDVEQLKKSGLSLDEALAHYHEWLYNVVKVHLASEWKIVPGHEKEYDELIDIIIENVSRFY